MPRARSRTVARRPTSWGGWNGTQWNALPVNSVTSQTVQGEADLETYPEPTIVRIRGILDVRQDGLGAAGAYCRWGAGIALFTKRAVAAGAASLQGPLSESPWDGWIWWATGSLVDGPAGDLGGSPHNAVRIEIDSKR